MSQTLLVDKQRILVCLEQIGSGSTSKIIRETYRDLVDSNLKDLVREGKIIKNGYGKNIYYTLPGESK